MNIPRPLRAAILSITAIAMYFAAISDDVYTIASPPTLGWHTILRKVESLLAFALLGMVTAWTLGRRRDLGVILVLGLAAYSVLIEIGQRFTGTSESIRMSLFDIACGAAGGLFALLLWRRYS